MGVAVLVAIVIALFLFGLTGELVQTQVLHTTVPIAERGVMSSFIIGGIIWLVVGGIAYAIKRKRSIKNASGSQVAGRAGPAASFDTWIDPAVGETGEQWRQNLIKFGRESAEQLHASGVQLFQSEFSRSGVDTYRDAFWLIAVDVECGRRSWWAAAPSVWVPKLGAGRRASDPPVAQQGDFSGNFQGTALLLTKSGICCVATIEGFLNGPSGRVNDLRMDMLFHKSDNEESTLKLHDWGLHNRGQWRQDPSSDYRRDGVDIKIQSIRFDEDYFNDGPRFEDGSGTVAALTNFVNSGGTTTWPSGFISFDY